MADARIAWNAIDHTGERFGQWEVFKRLGSQKWGCAKYLCRCDCGKEKEVSGRHLRLRQSLSYGCKRNHLDNPKTKPSEHPKIIDIAWASGIYEGEGCCNKTVQGTMRVIIGQKDPYILHKLQSLFGGSVSKTRSKSNFNVWNLYSVRARGFLMTIFTFLSPRRKEQIKLAFSN